MRKIALTIHLLLAGLWLAPVITAQVIGLQPTPQAVYYWDTGSSAWTVCTNSSSLEASARTPQAIALYGWNAGLGQWTPQTACPGSGGGGGGIPDPSGNPDYLRRHSLGLAL